MRRRLFLGGLAAAIAAPAIVARESIMAIKVARPDDTISGLQMLWQAERDWSQRFARALENVTKFGENITKDYGDRWTIIHPDEARLMRIGVDHGSPEGDYSAMVRGSLNERGEMLIGEIDRFRIYTSPPIMDPGDVRRWRTQTAQEIRAKMARAERQMRAALEPKGPARWR